MSERLPGFRPGPTPWRRLDEASRAAFPSVCSALLLVLLAAPLGLPCQAQLGDGAVLACVFHWSVARPGWMPPSAVFLLGVLADLLVVAPLGTSSLTLLVAHGLAVSWRPALAQGELPASWLAFVAVAALTVALDWALASLLAARVLPVDAALIRLSLTVALYPALAVPFGLAHRALADPEPA